MGPPLDDAPLRCLVLVESFGFQYVLDFVGPQEPFDAKTEQWVETRGFRVAVRQDQVKLLRGTTIDWVRNEKTGNAGFLFKNPNELAKK